MSASKKPTGKRDSGEPRERGCGADARVPSHGTKRLWATAALVFLVALGLRLIYLGGIRDIGFFDRPVSDGLIYDLRAQEIAAGDLLGSADFVHAPLYAYVLGAIEWVVGHDLWSVRLVQMLLGSASCVLLLLACRRFFGERQATLAAILLAFYPPALFFDGLIQKAGLGLFITTLLLWLLGCCASRPGWVRWLGSGLAMGLLVLTRQNAMALVPLLFVWLWVRFRGSDKPKLVAWSVACAVGLALALVPWAVRNKVVTGELVLTTPNLGQNFYMGNHLEATGTYVPHKLGWGTAELEQQEWARTAERETGRQMSAVEISDHFLDKSLEYIKSHPGHWLALNLKKTAMVWNAYESYDTEDYYLYRERSGILNVLDHVWHFGVLCPLGIAGIVLTRARWRELWFLYGWMLVTTVAVAVFVVFARYRLPLVPVLLMFASAGVVAAVRHLRDRHAGKLIGAVVAVVVASVVANWPVSGARQPDRAGYNNHCIILMELGRVEDALAEAERSLGRYPGDPLAHIGAGAALTQLGRFDEAISHLEQARRTHPGIPEIYRCLGNAYMDAGSPEAAAQQFRAGLRLDPEDFRGLTGLAAVLAQMGQPGEAVALTKRAVEIQPTYAPGYLNLGNVYLAMGRPDDAIAAYTEALRHRPDFADALFNIGVVELQRGNPEAAVDPLRRATLADPTRQAVKLALATALIDASRLPEACEVMERMLEADSPQLDIRMIGIGSRLVLILSTSPDPKNRDGAKAVALASRLCELTRNAAPAALRAYAAALAEVGQYDQAVTGAKLALERAEVVGLTTLAELIRAELASYEAGTPYRSAAPMPAPRSP